MSRLVIAALLLFAYAALCACVMARHRRHSRRRAAEAASLDGAGAVLILHASQSGRAEALAWQTARALQGAGRAVRLQPLGEVDAAELLSADTLLCVASTAGEGDAPDSAAAFVGGLMGRQDLKLSHLHYGLLALGDRRYQRFCGFGRALDAWLRGGGAQALFDPVEQDGEDPAAWQHWLQGLQALAPLANDEAPAQDAPYHPWRLVERRVLNPDSPAAPVCLLTLQPPPGLPLPNWQAGDLVQIQPGDGEPARSYTLASLPAEGCVQLLVRRVTRLDGSPGLTSTLLTRTLPLGASVALRWRAQPGFRIAANAQRPLILVGNGTGLAGLLAHLKARRASGGPPVWLVYGERRAAHEAHFGEEIEAWRRQGLLAHADRVFSRDGGPLRHVQQLLAAQQERLLDWVARGAAVYVCGSRAGMGQGVHEVLAECLGEPLLAALQAQGRYRRDVYY